MPCACIFNFFLNICTERAVKNYEKYEDRIFKSDKTRQNCKDIEEGEKIEVNDTVGAIALDFNDHVAATVSSGGNQFKFPGRVGHVSCTALAEETK